MGLFNDVQEAWERQRVARIQNNISNLRERIREYETARETVSGVKTSCQNGVAELETSYNKIADKEVKKTGVFEGEMADAMDRYTKDAKEENKTAIDKTGELLIGLDSQITKIDDKIAELNGEIDTWIAQL